jgi:hypothetical protein
MPRINDPRAHDDLTETPPSPWAEPFAAFILQPVFKTHGTADTAGSAPASFTLPIAHLTGRRRIYLLGHAAARERHPGAPSAMRDLIISDHMFADQHLRRRSNLILALVLIFAQKRQVGRVAQTRIKRLRSGH